MDVGRRLPSALRIFVLACALLAAAAFTTSAGAYPIAEGGGTTAPTIASDKPDYIPGEQVTLTGTGWAGDEVVHIVVNDTLGQTWQHTADVTATGDGLITDVFTLPSYFVSDYDVTATGPM